MSIISSAAKITSDPPLREPSGSIAKKRVVLKKVAFVLPHLGPGGAQRVVSNVASSLAARGINVHLITLYNTPPDAYQLPQSIKRHAALKVQPHDSKRHNIARVTLKRLILSVFPWFHRS